MKDEITDIASRESVDYTGFADISGYSDRIRATSGGLYRDYRYAISLGIDLLDTVVDLLWNRDTYENTITYRRHYGETNNRLDRASSIVASTIRKKGYDVIWIPAAERVDKLRGYGSVSHKFTARLAGFGWIGKSTLLVNPDHGPRVRWTTVLTNAPLDSENRILRSGCGDCRACVDACPVGAVMDAGFDENVPRDDWFGFDKCEAYFDNLVLNGRECVCGLCMAACPYGERKSPGKPQIF